MENDEASSSDVFEYLHWFFVNADFGPAHEDIMNFYQEQYVKDTGKQVPKGYKYE